MRSTPFFNATISAVAADARAERKRAGHDKAWSLAELHTYIRNNQDFIPNGERFRQRERISTAESMVTKWLVNVSSRSNKCSGRRVAPHLLLQIVPIPGTKRRKYFEENVAAETVQLDTVQMKILDDALAPGKVSGKRYADWIMATIDR